MVSRGEQFGESACFKFRINGVPLRLWKLKPLRTNIGAKRLMKLGSLILNLIKLVRRGKPPRTVFPHPRVFELTDRVRHCSLIKRTVDCPTYTRVTFESAGTKRNIQYSETVPCIEILNLIDSFDIEYEHVSYPNPLIINNTN